MILPNGSDCSKCYHLFIAGAQTWMLATWIALVMWPNTILKCRDEVSAKVKAEKAHETKVQQHYASVYGLVELLPSSLASTTAEKSSSALHDKAIQKTVPSEMETSQPAMSTQQVFSWFEAQGFIHETV